MVAWGKILGARFAEGRKSGRIRGQPDGMPLKEFRELEASAKIKTKKVMEILSKHKEFEPDNKVANAAIEVAVEILNLPGNTSTRLAAAKTLLEYTQRKPVVANETTLKNAEAFLDDLIKDEDDAATGSNP